MAEECFSIYFSTNGILPWHFSNWFFIGPVYCIIYLVILDTDSEVHLSSSICWFNSFNFFKNSLSVACWFYKLSWISFFSWIKLLQSCYKLLSRSVSKSYIYYFSLKSWVIYFMMTFLVLKVWSFIIVSLNRSIFWIEFLHSSHEFVCLAFSFLSIYLYLSSSIK